MLYLNAKINNLQNQEKFFLILFSPKNQLEIEKYRMFCYHNKKIYGNCFVFYFLDIFFKMLGNFLKAFIKKYDFLRKLLESYLKRVYNRIIENAYKRKGIE